MRTLTNNQTHTEPNASSSSQKLNWLRAAVLGANDGIVSVASIVVGVAGASNSTSAIVTAGVAGLVAGALSMGVGEYVSVSTQRDTEEALLDKELTEIATSPDSEHEELVNIYVNKGLTLQTANLVADELGKKDVHAAHFDAELGIDPNNLTDPWHAAYASTAAFFCGAIIPLGIITLTAAHLRIPVTFFGVLVALVATGTLSAYAGGSSKIKAIVRVVLGGILAMVVTFGVGKLFGIVGI